MLQRLWAGTEEERRYGRVVKSLVSVDEELLFCGKILGDKGLEERSWLQAAAYWIDLRSRYSQGTCRRERK